jgi:cell division protein FtsB
MPDIVGKRLLLTLLLALLVIFQAQLWLGRGSLPNVRNMQHRLEEQLDKNQLSQAHNERLGAEVGDLKEGLEIVEEKARMELGMVKPNEIFVQIAK